MFEPVVSVPLEASVTLSKFSGWWRHHSHLQGQGYRDSLSQVTEQTQMRTRRWWEQSAWIYKREFMPDHPKNLPRWEDGLVGGRSTGDAACLYFSKAFHAISHTTPSQTDEVSLDNQGCGWKTGWKAQLQGLRDWIIWQRRGSESRGCSWRRDGSGGSDPCPISDEGL